MSARTTDAMFEKLRGEVCLLREQKVDLYTALQKIKSQCAGHSDDFSLLVWQLAEEAIAKAEGRK